MMMSKQRSRSYFLVMMPATIGIGLCMPSFAAADYWVCTPAGPLLTSMACSWVTSPPSGYVCDTSQRCYPGGSAQGQAILQSQKPPKPGDRKPLAEAKNPTTSNVTKNPADKQTSTVKQPNNPPPPGAMKQSIPSPLKPCPTTARC
jgi:hypothetical protein